MSNRIYERFVECPGVIEIRWVSDDPDHHRPSEDMFLCQNNGIPEDYGKKDKKTTEQAHFYCCVCECQSASLKTLRAHCEGTQHKRKAEQFFQQFQHKQRKKNSANDSLSPDNSRYLGSLKALKLSQLRQYTPLVGLQYVEEYRSTESGDPPLYLCTLKGCKENNCEFNGEASEMFDHLKSQSHGWSYFHRVYGNEFHQEDYEFEDVLRRILVEEERYKIKEVKLKTNNKDYNTVRNNARPDSSYVREALELDKEKRTLPKPLPPRKPKPSSTISVTSPKEISSSPTREPPLKRQRSSSPISLPRVEATVAGDIKSEPDISNNSDNANLQNQRLSNQELNQINTIKPEQSIYSSDNPVFQLPPSLRIAHEAKPDLSIVDESEISSLQPVQAKKTNGHTIQDKNVPVEKEDLIKKFNHDVAHWVMSCMNKYYQYPGNRDTCVRKICDKKEYATLARNFSKNFRRNEKESYLAVNGTFDGLEMNLDMKDRIKMNIDMEFENKPLLPLE